MPTDLSSNIILGVVSGLLATLLTVGFRRVWLSILVPWIEELVYKDAKIEGTWYGLCEELDDERYDVVTLKRIGHHVTAHMTCSAGDDSGKTYYIVGSFRNLILSATYETEDRQGLDRGSMTLMLTANGTKLVGYLAFYSDPNHEINETPLIWYRDKGEFDKEFKDQIQRSKEEDESEENQLRMKELFMNAEPRRRKKKKNKEPEAEKKPNQTPEPTPPSVTPPADAGAAPNSGVDDL